MENQTNNVKKLGRPPQLPPEAVKVTVTFYNNQIVWLDRLAADIRLNSMAIVDRGTILRGILVAVMESGIDLTQPKTEKEIRDVIMPKLKQRTETGK